MHAIVSVAWRTAICTRALRRRSVRQAGRKFVSDPRSPASTLLHLRLLSAPCCRSGGGVVGAAPTRERHICIAITFADGLSPTAGHLWPRTQRRAAADISIAKQSSFRSRTVRTPRAFPISRFLFPSVRLSNNVHVERMSVRSEPREQERVAWPARRTQKCRNGLCRSLI